MNLKNFSTYKATKEYEEVKSFKDLENHNIKVGKSYLTFDYKLHKIKLYYKNKSLIDICNLLNSEYEFKILTYGVNLYIKLNSRLEMCLTPEFNKNVSSIGTYTWNSEIKINLNNIAAIDNDIEIQIRNMKIKESEE